MSIVTIIDYGSGNLRSAAKAFERMAAPNQKIIVTSDPADLEKASHIVLPGVGAFADCMNGLTKLPGMLDRLEAEVHGKRKPFLGICVGMQMLFETGHEHGAHKGLGWLKGEVVKISGKWQAASDKNNVESHANASLLQEKNLSHVTCRLPLKIPHMGWNNLALKVANHPLLAGIKNGDHAYFVHSYYARCGNSADVLATVEYGSELTAVVAKDNIMGTQFHPEKSQETGLRLIGNFLKSTGSEVLRD